MVQLPKQKMTYLNLYILKNNGTISHNQMEKMVQKVYATFNEKRKEQEAIEADFQDLEERKQIEERVKIR